MFAQGGLDNPDLFDPSAIDGMFASGGRDHVDHPVSKAFHHAAAIDQGLRVQNVDQTGRVQAKIVGGPAQHLDGQRIICLDSSRQDAGGQRAVFLGQQLWQDGFASCRNPCPQIALNGRPTRDGFNPAANPAAWRIRAAGHGDHVPDLARAAAGPLIDLAIQDQAAADSGPDKNRNHAAQPATGAHPQLARCGDPHVVGQHDRNRPPLAQHPGNLDVFHARNVGYPNDDPARGVDDAWHPDPDRGDVFLGESGPFYGVVHGLDQPLHDHLWALLSLGRLLGRGNYFAGLIHDGGEDLGASQVDSECVAVSGFAYAWQGHVALP